MRKNCKLIVWLSSCLLLVGCTGDVINAGSSTLNEEDNIRVLSDTFPIVSTLDSCSAICLTPDSFLLGECDTHFGTIRADILTQLACPEGYEYPNEATTVVDSVCLYLYYRSWYGDGNAPLGITVYEMDKATLHTYEAYPSTLNVIDYCSLSDASKITNSSRIVIPSVRVDSAYSTESQQYISCIRMRLTNEFAQRFFQTRDFSSQEAFNNQFKGLYICSDFGAGSILHITDITMTAYYHFTMDRPGVADSIIYDSKSFYANEEVRQVNRYIYPDRQSVLNHYTAIKDTSYIVSPANIYTRLSVRLDSIYQRMDSQLGESEEYRVYVNRANITIDVLYSDSLTERPRDNWEKPAPYMMLIKEDKFESFFANNERPTDTIALVAALAAHTDSLNNPSYSYTYDLSDMLAQQLRSSDKTIQELNFILVPVTVTTNSSTSTVTSVKQQQTLSATRIRSANDESKPMDVELVYSGFRNKH